MANSIMPMPSSGGSGDSGMNPVGNASYAPISGTTPGAEGPKLENLSNVSDTWGKAIPFTAGNIRVKVYQIWSSPFYEVADTATPVDEPKYPDIQSDAGLPAVGGGMIYPDGDGVPVADPSDNVSYQQPVTDPAKLFNAYIDVAYSGGYNMLLTSRIVGDIRFDGVPVYSYETRNNKFGFNFHSGVNRDRDTLIYKDLKEDTTYFPEQNYLVFKELSLSATQGVLPKEVDVLFRVQSTIGDHVERENVDEPEIPEGFNFPDWDNRRLYVYVHAEADYGKIYQYDIDTLKKIDEYNVVIAAQGFEGGLDNALWFPKQELMIGQQTGAGFAGTNRIFAVNIKTGQQKATYGENQFPTSADNSIRHMPQVQELGGSEVYGAFLYVNNPYTTVYACTVTGSADSDVEINVQQKDDWPDGPFASYTVKGKSGVGYLMKEGKLFRCTIQEGVKYIRDLIAPVDNALCVGTDLVTIASDGQTVRYSSTGQIRYNIQPDLYEEFGTSNIDVGYAANQRIAHYPDTIANNIAGSTGNLSVYYINLGTGKIEIYGSDPDRWTTAQLWDGFNAKLVVVRPHGGDDMPERGFIQLPYRQLGGEILLRDFIRAIFVSTGRYTQNQITFSDTIDYMVLGGGIFQSTTIGAVIKDICTVYRIDYIETEDGIHFFHNRFISSSADILATIKVEDLALISEGGSDNPTSFNTVMDAAISASSEISLSFIDPDADYTTNTVIWTNPNADFNSTGTVQFTLPLVITKNTALTLIRALYTDINTIKTKHQFRLPRSLNFYTKGDVVTIADGSFRETVRITQTDFNADYSVSCEADSISMRYFEPVVVPDVPPKPKRLSGSSSKTNGIVFDIPALIPEHNDIADGKLLQYMHLYGLTDDWLNGYFVRKSDIYRFIYKSGKDSKPIVYKAGAPLSNVFWEADETPLEIDLVYGTYDEGRNTDLDRLYNSAARNLALYGAAGRWEVVQFAEISEGAVRGILRGLRGTEDAASRHQSGDLFVIVSQAFTREARPVAEIGNTVAYRAVTVGGSILASPAIGHLVEGNSLKPFAPFNVEAFFDTDDILITWDRRDRNGNGWGVTPPMSEEDELYSVDIYDGPNVVRTIDSSTTDAVYTEAQQIADGLGGSTEITLCVYQISQVVGRGFGNKVTVNVN